MRIVEGNAHRQAGLADASEVAKHFGLAVETVLLWTERGGLRVVFPGLYDLEDCAGRLHRAAKTGGRS